jgi:hypothetical protein
LLLFGTDGTRNKNKSEESHRKLDQAYARFEKAKTIAENTMKEESQKLINAKKKLAQSTKAYKKAEDDLQLFSRGLSKKGEDGFDFLDYSLSSLRRVFDWRRSQWSKNRNSLASESEDEPALET